MTTLDTATFTAAIPPILSGIKTGGDGMRVQFDIPESEMGEAAKLLAMRGVILLVTVEVLKNKGSNNDAIQKRAVRKSVRAAATK